MHTLAENISKLAQPGKGNTSPCKNDTETHEALHF